MRRIANEPKHLIRAVGFAALGAAAVSIFALTPSFALAQDVQSAAATQKRDMAKASPAELRKQAQSAVETIQGTARDLNQQLQVARRKRDVVLVLCLSDKLSQVDVALRSAKARGEALSVALEREDTDRSHHESMVLQVLTERVQVLVGESNQCVGEETGFIGEAEISVSIDPNLPDELQGGAELLASPSFAPPSIGSGID